MKMKTVMTQLCKGWNTWNTNSVLSHVLLPHGLSINIGIKDYATGRVIRQCLIGQLEDEGGSVHPGTRSYDGSYTELTVSWRDFSFFIQTAAKEDQQYILISPVKTGVNPPAVFVEAGILWNHNGYVVKNGDSLKAVFDHETIDIFVTGNRVEESQVYSSGPYISVTLDQQVGVSTGCHRSLEEITQIVCQARKDLLESAQKFGSLADTYNAMKCCLAWDTIYEPLHKQVCSPVSRIWNLSWGGYVLFCWDTFFAAEMISLENKELAYANVFAILNEMTQDGFVPNVGAATGFKSLDRSQPPVGSMVVWDIYQRYHEKSFVRECYPKLCTWNQWFFRNRMYKDGTLCWGSNPYTGTVGNEWESVGVNDRYGAALESGLDNSPMYDDIPFNQETHMLALSDVGLTSLYINDCKYLIKLGDELGEDTIDLKARLDKAKNGLQTLWCEEFGLFLNKRTDTGEFSYRISPTNFYALFSDSVMAEQAKRSIKEHFYNPEEFWGDYILPSIARNDPAYPEQTYWRGRIWAPMNYLVYQAFAAAGQWEACRDLAEKSRELLMKEWKLHGHVHENYCADTGMGCGVPNSDKFYHWGGLLGYISLLYQFSRGSDDVQQ